MLLPECDMVCCVYEEAVGSLSVRGLDVVGRDGLQEDASRFVCLRKSGEGRFCESCIFWTLWQPRLMPFESAPGLWIRCASSGEFEIDGPPRPLACGACVALLSTSSWDACAHKSEREGRESKGSSVEGSCKTMHSRRHSGVTSGKLWRRTNFSHKCVCRESA